jgi:hypothetical protein
MKLKKIGDFFIIHFYLIFLEEHMQIMGILFTLIGFTVTLLYLLSKEKNLTGKDQ